MYAPDSGKRSGRGAGGGGFGILSLLSQGSRIGHAFRARMVVEYQVSLLDVCVSYKRLLRRPDLRLPSPGLGGLVRIGRTLVHDYEAQQNTKNDYDTYNYGERKIIHALYSYTTRVPDNTDYSTGPSFSSSCSLSSSKNASTISCARSALEAGTQMRTSLRSPVAGIVAADASP